MIVKRVKLKDKVRKNNVARGRNLLKYVRQTEKPGCQPKFGGWIGTSNPGDEALSEQEFLDAIALNPANAKHGGLEHLIASWPVGEHPTLDQCEDAVRTLLREGSIDESVVKWELHDDNGFDHLHIALVRRPGMDGKLQHFEYSDEACARTAAIVADKYGFSSAPGALYEIVDGRPVRKPSTEGSLSGGAGDAKRRTDQVPAMQIAADKINAIMNAPGAPKTWPAFHAALAAEGIDFKVLDRDGNPIVLIGVTTPGGDVVEVSGSKVDLAIASHPGAKHAGLRYISKIFADAPGQSARESAAGRLSQILDPNRVPRISSWGAFLDACEAAGLRYALRRQKKAGAANRFDAAVQVLVDGKWIEIKSSAIRLNVAGRLQKPIDTAGYKWLSRLFGPASPADIRHYPAAVPEIQPAPRRRKSGEHRYAGGRLQEAGRAYNRSKKAYEEMHGTLKTLRASKGQAQNAVKSKFRKQRAALKDRYARALTKDEKASIAIERAQLMKSEAEEVAAINRQYALKLALYREFEGFDRWLRKQDEYAHLADERTQSVVRPGRAHGIPMENEKESRERAVAVFAGLRLTVEVIHGYRHIYYTDPVTGMAALEDRGRDLFFHSDRDPRAVAAGLELSMKKFGGRVVLEGSQAFLAIAAREAVRMGIQDRIRSDDRMFALYVEAEMRLQGKVKKPKKAKQAQPALQGKVVRASQQQLDGFAANFKTLDKVLGADRYVVVADSPRGAMGVRQRFVGWHQGVQPRPAKDGDAQELAATRIEDAFADAKLAKDEAILVRPKSAERLHVIVDTTTADLGKMRAAGYTPLAVIETGKGQFQCVISVPSPSERAAVNDRVEAEIGRLLSDEYGAGEIGSRLPLLQVPFDAKIVFAEQRPNAMCGKSAELAKKLAQSFETGEMLLAPDPAAVDVLERIWDAHRVDVLRLQRGGACDESLMDWMILTRLLATNPTRPRDELETVVLKLSKRARGDVGYVRGTVDRAFSPAMQSAIRKTVRYHSAWSDIEARAKKKHGGKIGIGA